MAWKMKEPPRPPCKGDWTPWKDTGLGTDERWCSCGCDTTQVRGNGKSPGESKEEL